MHYVLSLEYNFCISCSPHSPPLLPLPPTAAFHIVYFIMFTFNNLRGAGAGQEHMQRPILTLEFNSALQKKESHKARGGRGRGECKGGRNMVFPIYFIYSWEPFCIFHGFCLSAQIENIIETINSMLLISLAVFSRSSHSTSKGGGSEDGLSFAAAPFPVIPISIRDDSKKEISSPYTFPIHFPRQELHKTRKKKKNQFNFVDFPSFFSFFFWLFFFSFQRKTTKVATATWFHLAGLGWSWPALGAGQHGQTSQVIY